MRIATLSDASAVHTVRWVEHFRARGHDVRVWSLERGPESLGVVPLPAPPLPLPRVLRYPLAARALARDLRAFAPDVVDAHFVPNYGLLGVLAGRRPLSVAAWGSDLLLGGRRDPLRRARARFVLARADQVLCDAENLAAAARELGAAPDRVHAIPWGVDLARVRPLEPRETGLVLSTRMHEPIYDLVTVIAGLAPVLAQHPHAHVAFIGDGSLRPALERLAAERLPAGRFRFLGRLAPDDLFAFYGRAEVYVSASHSDSTSQSLLEAMAAGAAPVVSDIAGNREWVRAGEGALLFRPGDAQELARALARALGDRDWRTRAAAHNRRVVEARADWTRNLQRIESLFESLPRVRGA
ncbi:MAG TPA: glycosyltransferase family 4 protein [Candidatus Limnocylindria bacterium]|nr:glycosyltransferase family 4 protein [Candidatus Limnocylindria bacterium]